MKLVKLSAIDSTNSYLKQLSKNKDTENWTVAWAEFQKAGRGQVNTKWQSDKGKNLTFSILLKFNTLHIDEQFYLNCAVSLGIYKALLPFHIDKLSVKWPNDIMAGNKKIGGILIENSLTNNKIYQSIIGIGINVNQETFSDDLPHASSLKNLINKEVNKTELLRQIVNSIKEFIEQLHNQQYNNLLNTYTEILFKFRKPQMFTTENNLFLGKIIGVSKNGTILIENEQGLSKSYQFKEIKYNL